MTSQYFDYPGAASEIGSPGPVASIDLGLLGDGDESDWALLFDYGDRRVVEAGATIIEEGTLGRSLFIVLSGSFSVRRPARRRGRTTTVGVLGAGDIVGEVGFAIGGGRSHSVTATQKSDVFELEWSAFEALAAADPALGVRILGDVLRIVANRTRVAER